MARKNPFENLLDEAPKPTVAQEINHAARGASRSISNTLDDLADKADKLLEGQTIVDLDPNLIDPSFLKDRIEEDADEYETLLNAIKNDGQSSPILVRPHPKVYGRYMVVFGSRRRKVAETLGIQVRAIIKTMSDREHVVTQGQENAARANLSFIERALLASNVSRKRYDDDNSTVMSALSIDKATLSKMLSVATIPDKILVAIGAAKAVGRDRWYELKTLLDRPTNLEHAIAVIQDAQFGEQRSNERFEMLLTVLKRGKKTTKTLIGKPRIWVPEDKGLAVDFAVRGKNYTILVKAKDENAIKFGEYLSENLEAIYMAFKSNTKLNED